MKNLLLNGSILGLNDETIVTDSGRFRLNDNGERVNVAKPLKFAELVLSKIIRSRTNTDEEAEQLFALAEKLNANLQLEEPTQMEVSDDEYKIIKNAIDSEAVIVKARFLQMVEELN